MKKFISDLGVVPSVENGIVLHCDSQGAIAQSKVSRSHSKSKHVLRKFHIILEIVHKKVVNICEIRTDDNIVDPLTKIYLNPSMRVILAL